MRINHNIAALNTYRQLNGASTAQAKSMEKLSSGLRINKAGDDAAGLAISEKMRGQIRGLEQAQTNAQDGISMIQTAEGALNETHSILQRMRELATQASNDTNTETDRGEIQKEINQLTSEINRIGNTTEFNTQSLLNGGTEEVAVSTVTAFKAETTPATSGTAVGGAAVSHDIDLSGLTNASNEVTIEVDGTSTYTIDLTALKTLDGTQDDAAVKALFENATDGGTGKLSDLADVTIDASGKITITSKSTGTSSAVDITVTGGETGDAALIESALGLNTPVETGGQAGSGDGQAGSFKFSAELLEAGQAYFVDGKELSLGTLAADADAEDIATALGAAITGDAILNAKYSVTVNNGEITLEQKAGNESEVEPEVNIAKSGSNGKFSASFQVGANEGQSMSIQIEDMRAAALKISGDAGAAAGNGVFTKENTVTDGTNNTVKEAALDVSTHANASAAITVINDAIESVSAQRSELGAYQNRLDHTINNLGTSAENLTAAESRIRDVDMAKEMMEQTKASILSQASQAMLAQANQMPQGVLQLLR